MARKIFFLFLLIAGIAVWYFFTPLRHTLSPEGFQPLRVWIENLGVLAPIVFGIIYIAATVFLLPGSVLTIGGGLLFGTAWGTLINLVSATLGAVLSFLLARYLGREFVARRLRGRLANLDAKIEKHGFLTVLYLRLIPLFPFNVLNYSLGLAPVRFWDYFWATFLGMAPGCFVYTSLGGVGRAIHWGDPKTWSDYKVWGPFALIFCLSLLIHWVKKGGKASMKKFFLWSGFLLALPVWGGERVEYYLDLGRTVSFPYHYEGLVPLNDPLDKEHYRFLRDGRGFILRITHYDKKGQMALNNEGWADFHVFYDEAGHFKEAAFYDAEGKMTINRRLGFAREKAVGDEGEGQKRLYFSPKGRKLRTPQNNLGIGPPGSLK